MYRLGSIGIRGHPYLPCDRVFGLVKRKLKKCDPYYTVKQVCEMILMSTEHGKFFVDLVENDDVLDIQKWWPEFYKKPA